MEMLEAEYDQSQTDLRLAFKRISELQSAIDAEMEVSDDSELDSEEDFSGSDTEFDTSLVNRKGSYSRTASFGGGDATGHNINRR